MVTNEVLGSFTSFILSSLQFQFPMWATVPRLPQDPSLVARNIKHLFPVFLRRSNSDWVQLSSVTATTKGGVVFYYFYYLSLSLVEGQRNGVGVPVCSSSRHILLVYCRRYFQFVQFLTNFTITETCSICVRCPPPKSLPPSPVSARGGGGGQLCFLQSSYPRPPFLSGFCFCINKKNTGRRKRMTGLPQFPCHIPLTT